MQSKKLVVFDFGETLAYYGGTQLCWREHYEPALSFAAQRIDAKFTTKNMHRAVEQLTSYDTRANPRTEEFSARMIFAPIAASLDINVDTTAFIEAFFQYFSRNIIVYDDTLPALRALKANGTKTAILTDVPYGMESYLVAQDMATAGLADHIDLLLTSVDVGYRKPDKRGLLKALDFFAVSPEEAVFVGNEPKDRDCALNAGVASILIDRTSETPIIQYDDHTGVHSLLTLLTF